MKHKEEIIRWANSPKGTKVWIKHIVGNWFLCEGTIAWNEKYQHIVDDEWAELRKAYVDGETIEYTMDSTSWTKSTICNIFDFGKKVYTPLGVNYYRIKPDEQTYYYQWERLEMNDNRLVISSYYLTDSEAVTLKYEEKGWRKIESSKREW